MVGAMATGDNHHSCRLVGVLRANEAGDITHLDNDGFWQAGRAREFRAVVHQRDTPAQGNDQPRQRHRHIARSSDQQAWLRAHWLDEDLQRGATTANALAAVGIEMIDENTRFTALIEQTPGVYAGARLNAGRAQGAYQRAIAAQQRFRPWRARGCAMCANHRQERNCLALRQRRRDLLKHVRHSFHTPHTPINRPFPSEKRVGVRFRLPVRYSVQYRSRRCPHARRATLAARDRKSTRLNSSHSSISYAVFCLKKKKKLRPPISSQKKKKNNKEHQ